MKVFLDECVDWRLMREVVGHEVNTARQMGWTIKNGALLALASQQFDVFVTLDRNLREKVASDATRRAVRKTMRRVA